jgi:uncharacterized protein
MSTSEQPPLPSTLPDEVSASVPESLVPAEERLSSLDLIRGFAILWILPANLPGFCGPEDMLFGNSPHQSTADRVTTAAVLLLVSMKFITLLSILFGVGLGLQWARAQARQDDRFPAYYLWRQVLLLVLGITHGLLLWVGDILASYALIGMAALVLVVLGRGWVRGGMIAGLAWAYLVPLGLILLVSLVGDRFRDETPPLSAAMVSPDGPPVSLLTDGDLTLERLTLYFGHDNQIRIHRHGGLGALVECRLLGSLFQMFFLLVYVGWYLLACFLLGQRLLEAGLFTDPEVQRRLTRWFIGLGLGIGVPCHILAVGFQWFRSNGVLPFALNTFGALPQALLYLALLLAWDRSSWLPDLQRRLRAVGRLALTNYLLQSVLCDLVFDGYGLGLYGQLGLALSLPVVPAIWLLQLLWSPLWLQYFTMGPVEWAWRSLADGRWRPFLKAA